VLAQAAALLAAEAEALPETEAAELELNNALWPELADELLHALL
jgi:hypothetical protein